MNNLTEYLNNLHILNPEYVAAQIKQFLKETVVPEENKSFGYGDSPTGWNTCRAEVLKRIDALDLPAGRHT